MTRRLIGKQAMTPAEKQQRYRDLRNPKSKLYRLTAKKQRRAEREAELGAKIWALPERRAGVLYVDPPIDWEPYSRVTGMDRAAAHHYPTMTFERFSAIELP